MNPAVVLSIVAASLQVGVTLLLLALGRAPGWQASRTFAWIAGTAALYSISDVFINANDASDVVRLAGTRINFALAALHMVAWLPYTFGGVEARWDAMPRVFRRIGALVLVVAVATWGWGGLVQPDVLREIAVPWAHVTYRVPVNSVWGDAYSAMLFSLVVVLAVTYARRGVGSRLARAQTLGFLFFMLAAAMEVLVQSGVLVFPFMADVGFLSVVLPVTAETIARFVRESRRLSLQSVRLLREVDERTVERNLAQEALLESERLATLGRLAAGVGHEINNPLTYLSISVETLEAHLDGEAPIEDAREAVAHARDGVRRIARVVETLRSFTGGRDGARGRHRLGDLAEAALRVAGPQLRGALRIEKLEGSAPPVRVDEAALVQVIVNVSVNAAQAVREAGRTDPGTLRLSTCRLADGRAELALSDDGPGIPPDVLPRLMTPYFTTRAGRGGTGLGLFLSKGIIEAHDGELLLESTPGVGTTVRIRLPAAPSEPDVQPPTADQPPLAMPQTRVPVLVVDDEPLVALALSSALGSIAEVIVAHDGAAALAHVATRPDLAAIVCDLMMPGMTGVAVAEHVAREHPALRERMLFVTGGALTDEAEQFLSRPDVLVLPKPVDRATLQRALAPWLASVAASA